jgi:molecular chaperone Hsp33
LQSLVNPGGQGRCIVVLDPTVRTAQRTPYQGVVPLEGTDIAAAIESYMLRSEQLATRLWLAADQDSAVGILLQKLPESGGKSAAGVAASDPEATARARDEDWQRLCILAETLTREELLETSTGDLVNRLFWEEDLRMFDPQTVTFRCTCSRSKVAEMLVMLGEAELDSMLSERDSVDVHCDYCGQHYRFDAVDARALFHGAGHPSGSSAVH